MKAVVNFRYEATADTFQVVDSCENPCRGKKHHIHAECDTSCDGPCGTIHRTKLPPDWELGSPDTTELKKVFTDVGESDEACFTDVCFLSDPIAESLNVDAKKYSVDIPGDHFNKEPCSYQWRLAKYHVFKVLATYEIYRETTAEDGNTTKQSISTGKNLLVATATYPTSEISYQTPVIACLCSIVEEERLFHSELKPKLKEKETTKDEHSSVPPGILVKDGDKQYALTTKMEQDSNLNVVVNDINTCSVSCENPTDRPLTYCIEPGTAIACDDGMHQTMVVMSEIDIALQPGQIHWAEVPIDHAMAPGDAPRLEDLFAAQNSGRVACIEMLKDAPDPSVKYRFETGGSDNLTRLAQLYNSERFRTPIGQLRMWIVSDHPTLEEVQKHLLPPPGESTYVRALRDVAVTGNVELDKEPFRGLVEPHLLVGDKLDTETTKWFVHTAAGINAKGLISWLEANPTKFSHLWDQSDAEYGPQHAADIANALCLENSPPLRAAAVEFLTKAVPPDSRADVAKAGGLRCVMEALLDDDADAATTALDVAELYKAPACKQFLQSVNGELPGSVKTRAAALLKQEQ